MADSRPRRAWADKAAVEKVDAEAYEADMASTGEVNSGTGS